jgi:hypothetical protein
MTTTYRAVAAALVLGATAILGSGGASAATAGNFSPLKSVIAGQSGGVEQATWGRRCYRECHIGHHGRRYCVWECYRPRRWW